MYTKRAKVPFLSGTRRALAGVAAASYAEPLALRKAKLGCLAAKGMVSEAFGRWSPQHLAFRMPARCQMLTCVHDVLKWDMSTTAIVAKPGPCRFAAAAPGSPGNYGAWLASDAENWPLIEAVVARARATPTPTILIHALCRTGLSSPLHLLQAMVATCACEPAVRIPIFCKIRLQATEAPALPSAGLQSFESRYSGPNSLVVAVSIPGSLVCILSSLMSALKALQSKAETLDLATRLHRAGCSLLAVHGPMHLQTVWRDMQGSVHEGPFKLGPSVSKTFNWPLILVLILRQPLQYKKGI